MNKTHLLFQMTEHPQNYMEDQWNEVLSDTECRECYTLMAMARGFYLAQREITDDEMEAEWNRLAGKPAKTVTPRRRILRVAAVLFGVLMLTGIAFATVRLARLEWQKTRVEEQRKATPKTSGGVHETEVSARPVVFDNVPLSQIVGDIAAHYQVRTEIRNKEAGKLRFYFVWQPQDSLQNVIRRLNQFKRVNIVSEGGKLVVR